MHVSKGEFMWGYSIHFWEAVWVYSSIGAVVFGALTAVSLFVSTWVGYRVTDAQQKAASEQILVTKHETALALKEQERLRNDNLSLQREMEKEKSARVDLERRFGPRKLSDAEKTKLEQALAGLGSVDIYRVEDMEASLFAENLK